MHRNDDVQYDHDIFSRFILLCYVQMQLSIKSGKKISDYYKNVIKIFRNMEQITTAHLISIRIILRRHNKMKWKITFILWSTFTTVTICNLLQIRMQFSVSNNKIIRINLLLLMLCLA